MMQKTEQKFYELADSLLRESGLLANRPSWINLRQLVHEFLPDLLDTDCRSHTYAILLVLLRNPEKSPERAKKLAAIIESACKSSPDELFIDMLRQLAPDDLTSTLLPQIYCTDSRGSIAVYLAAKIGLHVEPDAFQYFLTARTWQQTDLINLAFLVRPSEQLKVSTILEQAAANESSAINREIFTEFRHILFGEPPQQPLLPDIAIAASSGTVITPAPTINEDVSEDPPEVNTTARKGSSHRAQAFSSRVAPTTDAKGKKDSPGFSASILKIIETNQSALLVLFVITTIFLVATGLSKWFVSDSAESVTPPANAGKLPSHWTDSATREKITERYLAADKDYRMGELYLTRDRFSEALILFEDALSIRPDHTLALYRAGYCRLHIKDYAGARTALEKALKIDPTLRYANLLLARAAAAQLDNKGAESHFNRELELAKDPVVAEEFANFLHNTGKEVEAESLINKYQALYPDRILILTRKPDKSEKEEQRQ
ncbi:MAG: hypothetical protein CVV42_14555 [Candidatus Riflebacteria bacterium HGW-Riflebacteria-2]|jgi:hypothetical protein|nr:MAG: hypothetical protein CVV42_14555 [Candidatus Riflebacteria bacterium HGW-Riflebacteria-2]